MTYQEWLKQSNLDLLDARLLLSRVIGKNSAYIIAHPQERLKNEELSVLEGFKRRRQQGESLAYILGEKEFYGRMFTVSHSVLVPRPETEELVEHVLRLLNTKRPLKLWDIGTGSGVIAISLKLESPNWQLFASDVFLDALKIAEHNAKTLAARIQFAAGSWFATSFANQIFDAIVSNPPYIHPKDPSLAEDGVCYEPRLALSDEHDGLESYRILVPGAVLFLKKGGLLFLEHGANQGEKVRDLLYAESFLGVRTVQDYSGHDRFTYGYKA